MSIDELMKLAHNAGNLEYLRALEYSRKYTPTQIEGFDVANAYLDLRAAIEQFGRERFEAGLIADITGETNE